MNSSIWGIVKGVLGLLFLRLNGHLLLSLLYPDLNTLINMSILFFLFYFPFLSTWEWLSSNNSSSYTFIPFLILYAFQALFKILTDMSWYQPRVNRYFTTYRSWSCMAKNYPNYWSNIGLGRYFKNIKPKALKSLPSLFDPLLTFPSWIRKRASKL